jgi:hypothetical protein
MNLPFALRFEEKNLIVAPLYAIVQIPVYSRCSVWSKEGKYNSFTNVIWGSITTAMAVLFVKKDENFVCRLASRQKIMYHSIIMKANLLTLLLATGILTFLAGWFLNNLIRPSNQAKETQAIGRYIDSSSVNQISSNKFSDSPKGRFILANSNCAGFHFINKNTVLWTNEIFCNDPDTLRLTWLSDSIFMTRSTLRTKEHCPPKVDIYKVMRYDGKHLALLSIGTGWTDAKDEMLDLTKQGK